MFAGYEGLVNYYVDQDGDGLATDMFDDDVSDIPAIYLPYEPTVDPWFQGKTGSNDFLLLAEGSELEGPLPLITIPKDGSGSFNIDEFVVRIMAIDHQVNSSITFSISEDVQVFLTQLENGIYAYVHYFTLYDSLARGFVRPFCLAYVTYDYSKLMYMSNELMAEFGRVSECFKSGNRLVFFRDMAHTLSDLQFTRERFLECHRNRVLDDQSADDADPVRSDNTEDGKLLRAIRLDELDEAISEAKSILQILNETLEKNDHNSNDRRCVDLVASSIETPLDSINFKITHVLNSSQKNGTDGSSGYPSKDMSSNIQVLTDSCEPYKPKLKTNLKPTIQKSLRSIHTLCDNQAEKGLEYLGCIYKYFRRDCATLISEREDSSALDPSCSLLTIGRTVYLNFLQDFDIVASGGCPIASPKSCSYVCSPTGTLGHRWRSADTLGSFYSCESLESFLSCQDSEVKTGTPQTPSDQTLPLIDSLSLDRLGSDVDIGDVNLSGCDSTEMNSDLVNRSGLTLSRPQSLSLGSKTCEKSTPVSVISISDHILNMKETSKGIGLGILQLVRQFPFAVHLIYSLMCGRPVVVLGSTSYEKEIRDLVTALWLFVPGHSSKSSLVLPWTTAPLKLSDLANLKLCGLGKPEKKTFEWMISRNLMNYVTLFYFNRKSLWSPEYKGGILSEIVGMNQNFDTEGSYISFVHSKLFELSLKCFSYFHGFCMRKSAAYFDKLKQVEQQEAWKDMSKSFSRRLGLTDCDRRVVEYLTEIVIFQQIRETNDTDFGEEIPAAICLDQQPCCHFS